ncbi:DUF2057 domain-containing protein [Sodalis glossinidius]|nr:DUF2057 domain-containing protein [Sodalis glossinidius]
MATTLQLPEELELLIVDGKTLGSVLLRGASSLELKQGHHQMVFTLVQPPSNGKGTITPSCSALYIVIGFSTGEARRLKFVLPTLASRAEGERFCHQPLISLQDQDQKPLPVSVSRLDADKNGLLSALEQYNRRYGPTVPAPRPVKSAVNPPPLTGSTSGHAEQMLRFWFLQADMASRERFLAWVRQRDSASSLETK